MAHHKLPNIAQKLETVKTILLNTIEMIEDEKKYLAIMQQISKIHSELNNAEKLIVEDLTEDDLFKT